MMSFLFHGIANLDMNINSCSRLYNALFRCVILELFIMMVAYFINSLSCLFFKLYHVKRIVLMCLLFFSLGTFSFKQFSCRKLNF